MRWGVEVISSPYICIQFDPGMDGSLISVSQETESQVKDNRARRLRSLLVRTETALYVPISFIRQNKGNSSEGPD